MYQLHYVELAQYRRSLNCQIDLVAGDTDSFFLACKNVALSNLLRCMLDDGLLDTSNYPVHHDLYDSRNTNKVGLFKDESGGEHSFQEWIFLRPKCYSMLRCDDSNSVRKAKGVTHYAIKNQLNHQHYQKVYAEGIADQSIYVTQARIGSINHQLYTMRNQKLALKMQDDKRAWIAKNNSLPYGHYQLSSPNAHHP